MKCWNCGYYYNETKHERCPKCGKHRDRSQETNFDEPKAFWERLYQKHPNLKWFIPFICWVFLCLYFIYR